jgi:hypothetical protein
MPIPRRLEPPRSPKAGRPPEVVTPPPRVRRRQKTAHVAMRKGAGFLQTSEGPRVILGVKKPKAKKR